MLDPAMTLNPAQLELHGAGVKSSPYAPFSAQGSGHLVLKKGRHWHWPVVPATSLPRCELPPSREPSYLGPFCCLGQTHGRNKVGRFMLVHGLSESSVHARLGKSWCLEKK